MGLGNLRDKLLQAGLVSEDEARKSEEAQARRPKKNFRPRRKPRPREDAEIEASLQLTPEEIAASAAKKAERSRQAELKQERNANRKRAAADRRRAEDVRRVAGALGLETTGTETFFFQTRKGKIQRILLDAKLREQIESGALAIIEHPLPHAVEFVIVPREGAEAVLGIDPRAVRFYNRSPEEFVGGRVAAPKPDRTI